MQWALPHSAFRGYSLVYSAFKLIFESEVWLRVLVNLWGDESRTMSVLLLVECWDVDRGSVWLINYCLLDFVVVVVLSAVFLF